jgi:hypothetical protein
MLSDLSPQNTLITSFYSIKPATRPTAARTVAELPLKLRAPEVDEGELPDEVEDEDPPVVEAAAPVADREASVLTAPAEMALSDAPAVEMMLTGEGLVVPFWEVALAAVWKASKLLFAVGLMANTIPD